MSFRGNTSVASDKSLSHRALILASLISGDSQIENLLMSEDVEATWKILHDLGVGFSHLVGSYHGKDSLTVSGLGTNSQKWTVPQKPFYCGNSGTTMRLLLGVFCGLGLPVKLTGDDSLNQRPMERVIGPLTEMGGRFSISYENGRRLVCVEKHSGLASEFFYQTPVASAQVKSALLLAALCAHVPIRVQEPFQSRNHTEILLQHLGVHVEVQEEECLISLKPSTKMWPLNFSVPGDFSSASFFMAAALITPNSDILIQNVNINPTRTGFLEILLKMGADITILNERHECGELVGDLHVKSSDLRNIRVGGDVIPKMIDEIPILALVAAHAQGEMVLSDASELRVKESDRIHAICTELSKFGVSVIEKQDGFLIEGGKPLHNRTQEFSSYGDHRMAMMLLIAKATSQLNLGIDDIDCINTSFPSFFEVLNELQG